MGGRDGGDEEGWASPRIHPPTPGRRQVIPMPNPTQDQDPAHEVTHSAQYFGTSDTPFFPLLPDSSPDSPINTRLNRTETNDTTSRHTMGVDSRLIDNRSPSYLTSLTDADKLSRGAGTSRATGRFNYTDTQRLGGGGVGTVGGSGTGGRWLTSGGGDATDRYSTGVGLSTYFVRGQPLVLGTNGISPPVIQQCVHSNWTSSVIGSLNGYEAGPHSLSGFTSGGAPPMGELLSWQQRQQLSNQVPRNNTTHTQYNNGMETFRTVADEIIHEKDLIIDSQRLRILELETNALRLTADHNRIDRLSSNQINGPAGGGPSYNYRSANLNSARQDVVQLEAQLGAAEYEIRKLQESTRQQLTEKDDLVKSLRNQIGEKDKELSDWSARLSALTNEHEVLKIEAENQKAYIENLPTVEEHNDNILSMKRLTEELSSCRSLTEQLDKKTHDLTRRLESRDKLIESLESNQSELRVKALELQKSNSDLELKLSSRADLVEMERLREEIDRCKTALDNSDKVLSVERRAWAAKQASAREASRSLQESLDHESACVQMLKDEITAKEQLIRQCRQATKECEAEKQTLMKNCLDLEKELKQLEELTRDFDIQIVNQLVSELASCVNQVRTLVGIGSQMLDGEEPNISALLGLRDLSTTTSTTVGDGALRQRLADVQSLRRDVDRMRDKLSDKVAVDLGRRLTCTQQ